MMGETVKEISDIIADAALAGVYDQLTEEWTRINESFQDWLDNSYFALQNSNPLLRPACVNSVLPHLADKYGAESFLAQRISEGKKITYYNGVFELYSPYTIIEEWEKRLSKIDS